MASRAPARSACARASPSIAGGAGELDACGVAVPGDAVPCAGRAHRLRVAPCGVQRKERARRMVASSPLCAQCGFGRLDEGVQRGASPLVSGRPVAAQLPEQRPASLRPFGTSFSASTQSVLRASASSVFTALQATVVRRGAGPSSGAIPAITIPSVAMAACTLSVRCAQMRIAASRTHTGLTPGSADSAASISLYAGTVSPTISAMSQSLSGRWSPLARDSNRTAALTVGCARSVRAAASAMSSRSRSGAVWSLCLALIPIALRRGAVRSASPPGALHTGPAGMPVRRLPGPFRRAAPPAGSPACSRLREPVAADGLCAPPRSMHRLLDDVRRAALRKERQAHRFDLDVLPVASHPDASPDPLCIARRRRPGDTNLLVGSDALERPVERFGGGPQELRQVHAARDGREGAALAPGGADEPEGLRLPSFPLSHRAVPRYSSVMAVCLRGGVCPGTRCAACRRGRSGLLRSSLPALSAGCSVAPVSLVPWLRCSCPTR